MATSFLGTTWGMMVASPLCGYLSDALGWQSGFYAVGIATFVWLLCWQFFVHETPEVLISNV